MQVYIDIGLKTFNILIISVSPEAVTHLRRRKLTVLSTYWCANHEADWREKFFLQRLRREHEALEYKSCTPHVWKPVQFILFWNLSYFLTWYFRELKFIVDLLFDLFSLCQLVITSDKTGEKRDVDPNAGRFVRYQFTPAFLRLRQVGAT